MILSIIVAMDENGGIGKDNRVPWHLPADLKRFKRLTMGHHLLVGRKTYESIGKALPGRIMLVLSRNHEFQAEGIRCVRSLDEAVALASRENDDELFIGGGADVFALAYPRTSRIYLTEILAKFEVDTHFPAWQPADWLTLEQHEQAADEANPHPTRFRILERIKLPETRIQ